MTRSLKIDNAAPRQFYLNADGLNDSATLRIELLDHEMNPLPAYSWQTYGHCFKTTDFRHRSYGEADH